MSSGGIDIHTHYAHGVPWSIGMFPEQHSMYHGAITVADAGSMGRNGFPHFYDTLIRRDSRDGIPRVDMKAFINIVAGGLANQHHECFSLEYLNVDETVALAREYPDAIVGVKVRIGWLQASPTTWREALRRGRKAAEKLGLPLMVHINHGPDLAKILSMMAEGDIVTHCYHGRGRDEGSTILTPSGRLRTCVKNALRRNIRGDLGHGQGGYSHLVALAAVLDEMLSINPECINLSTDLHRFCVHGPTFNLWSVMSKALTWPGVDVEQVLRFVTWNAAKALRLPRNRGTLEVGSPADLSIWQVVKVPGGFPMIDADKHEWRASVAIQPVKGVRGGILF